MSNLNERMSLMHEFLKAFIALQKQEKLRLEFDEADADYHAKLYWIEMFDITIKNFKIMFPIYIILLLIGSIGAFRFLIMNTGLMMILWFLSYKKVKDKYYSKNSGKRNYIPLILEEEWEKLENAKENLEHLLSDDQYRQDISSVPKRYRSTEMTSYLYDIVSNNRADTLKEALNILEDDLHRMRMEQKQQELIEAQKRAEEAANSASNDAIFLALYYYDKF